MFQSQTVQTFLDLLQNSATMGFGALLFGVIAGRLSGMRLTLAIGVLFGAGAILSMVDPLTVRPGIFVDSRGALVVISGLFGGPIAALVSGGMAIVYREWLGGAGVFAGQVSILVAVIIGSVAGTLVQRYRRGKVLRWDVLILATTAPLLSLGALVLPFEDAMSVLRATFVPAVAVRFFGIVFLGLLVLHELRRLEAERDVTRLAFADDLTGLSNRRAFFLHLEHEWQEWKRHAQLFSIVMIDIDRFKSINDRFGHPVGDRVIKVVGDILREEARAVDIAARVGGEEFALLLPRTSSSEARAFAERARRRIENASIDVDGETVRFTVSVGISADASDHLSLDDAFSSADQALYDAKRSGRNRVVVSPTITVMMPRRLQAV